MRIAEYFVLVVGSCVLIVAQMVVGFHWINLQAGHPSYQLHLKTDRKVEQKPDSESTLGCDWDVYQLVTLNLALTHLIHHN